MGKSFDIIYQIFSNGLSHKIFSFKMDIFYSELLFSNLLIESSLESSEGSCDEMIFYIIHFLFIMKYYLFKHFYF